jgi:hypothetical protein
VAYWLIAELQESIDETDVPFTLHIVIAEDMPPNSINGPCKTIEDVLRHMMTYCWYDEWGFTHLK